MRTTKSTHHQDDRLTIVAGDPGDPFFAACVGLAVQINGLYWEEDGWGYSVSPVPGTQVSATQARYLAMVTLHDRDFVAPGHD